MVLRNRETPLQTRTHFHSFPRRRRPKTSLAEITFPNICTLAFRDGGGGGRTETRNTLWRTGGRFERSRSRCKP